jgi:ribosomal protein L37AE/L43A
MTIESDTFFALLSGLLIAGIFAVRFAYERRSINFYDRQLTRHVFHCLKCAHLYTNEGTARLSKCPKCNQENARLSF